MRVVRVEIGWSMCPMKNPSARRRVEKARRCLDDLLAGGDVIYGVNTGFGKLANQRIEVDEVLALQENLLRSHAVGMGPLLSISTSRLALTLRIQALAKGYSEHKYFNSGEIAAL